MLGKVGEIAKALGNLDVGKAKDTVDALWDHREKIADTADLVWDNRESIQEVIEFFGENKDAIVGVIRELPDLLATTGNGIAKAGESAIAASSFLVGGGDDDEDGAIQDITEFAADALARCVDQLGSAVGVLTRAGEEIDKIALPTIDPQFTEVVGFKVISGLDFGTAPIAEGISDRMRDGAENLSSIADDFGVVADQLKKLGARLNDTGGDLNNVGGLLQENRDDADLARFARELAPHSPQPGHAAGWSGSTEWRRRRE